MSYIGVPPVSGDFVVLDAITASATASYTLQRGSVNFSPESANHMLVSLNGSIQKPNSSFTLNGSTITFSSTLASSDSIDFILVLGNVNAVGVATTVADSAITDAKTNFVSTSSGAGLQIKGDGTTDGTLQLNCSQNTHGIKLKSPAHSSSSSYTLTFPTTDPSAGKVLQTDGSGNLSFADAGGNNKPMFEAFLNADQDVSGGTATKVAFGAEQHDTDSVYDHSSNYRFTVPSGQAGNYYIYASVQLGQEENYLGYGDVRIYKNGSAYKVTNYENSLGDSGSYQKFEIMPIDANMVLAVGDYVEIYAVCGAFGGGSNHHFKGSTSKKSWFGGYKLIT